jgi:hypothetical protein
MFIALKNPSPPLGLNLWPVGPVTSTLTPTPPRWPSATSPRQIPHGLTRAQTRTSAVRTLWLTTWAMARTCLPSLRIKGQILGIGPELLS